MSETSEKMGRCRSEVDDRRGSPCELVIADAIDRLAADVAAVMAKVDAVSPEDVRHFVDSEKAWVKLVEDQRDAAVRERDEARTLLELAQVQRTAAYADRDEARAEVYQLKCGRTETSKERDAAIRERDAALADAARLKAELAARQPDGNSPEIPDSSPAAPQPAAPPAGWMTEEERRILSARVRSLRDQRRAMERGGQTLGYSADSCGIKREADTIDRILARAGSPPEQTAALWLTEKERAVVEQIASMIEQWFHMAWSDTDEKRCAVLRSILARAGSPPVVEVPPMGFAVYGFDSPFSIGEYRAGYREACLAHRAALDKAGVAWKEVGRE